jgi:hypothetical protein
MIQPETLRFLQATDNEQLRQIITHASAIHAYRDQDGGQNIATALRRVADRLTGAPRRPA